VELGLVHTLFMLCYNSIYWVYFIFQCELSIQCIY